MTPYLLLIPGITRRLEFTFHRDCYIRMPEITTPYTFAMANIVGLTATNMISGHTYTNYEMTMTFKQPTRVASVDLYPPSLATFVDWEQSQSFTANTTIRFPYGMMTLDDSVADTDITYTADTVSHTWSIPSRVSQADLV